MSKHFKQLCENCGKVISQCRCMDCNKSITYGLCDKCKDVKDKLSKPEKITMEKYLKRITHADEELALTQAYMYSKGNSESSDQWQAYHDQEMQRVVEQKNLKEGLLKYFETKVKKLEQQIKDLTSSIGKSQAEETQIAQNECKRQFKIIQELRQQLKEKDCEINESYPLPWKHCLIHLNPEKGIMHSDGDHSVRDWIEAKIKESREVSEDKFKKIKDRMKFLYGKIDGTYQFPNSEEGDLLRMVKNLINGDKKGE